MSGFSAHDQVVSFTPRVRGPEYVIFIPLPYTRIPSLGRMMFCSTLLLWNLVGAGAFVRHKNGICYDIAVYRLLVYVLTTTIRRIEVSKLAITGPLASVLCGMVLLMNAKLSMFCVA